MKLLRFSDHAFDADRIVQIFFGVDNEAENQYAIIFLDTPTVEFDEEDKPYGTPMIHLEGVDAILFSRWLERNSEDMASNELHD